MLILCGALCNPIAIGSLCALWLKFLDFRLTDTRLGDFFKLEGRGLNLEFSAILLFILCGALCNPIAIGSLCALWLKFLDFRLRDTRRITY